MFFRIIRAIAVPALLIILLFLSILVFADTLINRQSVQAYLIHRISDSIGIDIRTQEIDLNLLGGIGVLIHGFEAKSKKGDERVTAARVRIILDTGDLIRGRITPTSLYLIQPEIELFLKDDFDITKGKIGSGIKGMPILWIPRFQSIAVDNGHVSFRGRDFYLDALFLDVRQTSLMPPALNLKAKGKIGYQGQEVPFDTNGIILPPFGKGSSTTLDMMFETGKAPLRWIPWPESMPFKQGVFKFRLIIEGDPKEATSVNGKVIMEPFQFALFNNGKEKSFSIPELTLDFQSDIKGRALHVHSLLMKNKDFSFDIDMALDPMGDSNPYLELNVKSEKIPVGTFKTIFPSPLLPSWLEDRLFPMLNAGDIKLKKLMMKGTIDRFRHLNEVKNQPVLEMDFECHDLEVLGGGIQLPFKEVSALVSLKEGDFRISGIKGVFGDSEIRNAELNIHGLFNDYPSYEGLLNGSFDIQELLRQREIKFIPTDMHDQLNQLQELAGRMECGIRFGYEHDWEYPRLLSGQFLFENCTVIRKEVLLPLRLKDAEIQFETNGRNRFTGTGSWGDSAFRAEGDFNINKNKIDLEKMNISADVDIDQAVRALFDQDISPMTVKRPVASNISVSRKSSGWGLQGDIDLNSVILESDDIIIDPQGSNDKIFFDLEFNQRDIVRLKKVLFNMNKSSIELSGSYDLQNRYFSEMDLHTQGLSMEDLGIYFKKKEIQARGQLKGGIRLVSSSPELADTNVMGKLEGKGLCFHSSGFSSPISGCLFDLDISGKQLVINHWKMHMGESMLLVSGKLKGWERLKGDILVESDFLDMSDIYATRNVSIKKDEKDKTVMDLIHKSEIGVRLDVKKGIWRKLKYGPLVAELDFKNSDIYIKDSKIGLENGSLTINGRSLKGDIPELLFSGHIKLKNQPVDELIEEIGAIDGELKGRLTMDAEFMVEGNEKRDLVPSLTGSGEILIEEGLIKRSRVFIKVLDFLSLQNIFKKRPPELREEGFYFENMSGDVSIDKGVLRSENFVMKSPVFNAVAYGEADIPKRQVDFILGAQPHGTIDSLVSKIPLLGYIITGENGSILAYPFRVQGPVSNPEVTFIPFEKLGEGIGGVFKRLFLTPKRLFDELNRGSKSKLHEDTAPKE